MQRALMLALVLVLGSCARGLDPVDSSSSDACTFCRMAVTDPRFAAQLVAPGEEPRFFDDIGCFAAWLKGNAAAEGAIAFVADHRTGRWVRAGDAVYTRATAVSTPMGSNILAYADAASRRGDPAAVNGQPMAAAEVFAGGRVPGGQNAR